jgi:hypothetical protein
MPAPLSRSTLCFFRACCPQAVGSESHRKRERNQEMVDATKPGCPRPRQTVEGESRTNRVDSVAGKAAGTRHSAPPCPQKRSRDLAGRARNARRRMAEDDEGALYYGHLNL